jgi:stage II sporulation protein D
VKRIALALAAVAIACSTRATGRAIPTRPPDPAGQRQVRVALVAASPRVGAIGAFTWLAEDGRTVLATGRAGEQWAVERESPGARVRAINPAGAPTPWGRVIVARPNGSFVTVNGKRYRGFVTVLPIDSGLVVVNHLGIEDYLRGVVPVEMGRRRDDERAALEAQAVASRSYASIRVAAGGDRGFDLRGSTADQAYGGVDVEYDAANLAVDATRGLVLRYDGRVADAPYSSTCGGTTAEAPEVWRTPGAPYLQRVSDRIGGSERDYCDIAPRYRWTRALSDTELNAALERYLHAYASVPGGRPGRARSVAIRSRTPSGRVGVLEVETDRGTFPVRGNDMRYVLRSPGGEILPSTYFSVESEYGGDGLISRVTVRGQGNGHGIGMCQWGAIGRARAGQSFRTILGTYYPGTSVGSVE